MESLSVERDCGASVRAEGEESGERWECVGQPACCRGEGYCRLDIPGLEKTSETAKGKKGGSLFSCYFYSETV